MTVTQEHQSGMGLLEALIGILIFSLGILALVAMQAGSVSTVADAQYRVEAVNLANRLLSQIWVNVDRTNDAPLQNSLADVRASDRRSTVRFRRGRCDERGRHRVAERWSSRRCCPASATDVPADPGRLRRRRHHRNRVTITLCWIAPNEPASAPPHRHTVVAYVN